MIVTPFGDLAFGDQAALQSWASAHDLRHRTENRAIINSQGVALPYSSLDGQVDEDWLQRHVMYHLGMLKFMPNDQSVSAQLLDTPWTNDDNFQFWHQMHNGLHIVLDQSLGIQNG